VSDDACASYRAMLERLEELERDTYRHVHKGNNVLFSAAEDRLSITEAPGD
jgi:regulator of cell morphogenesis and NO signaling